MWSKLNLLVGFSWISLIFDGFCPLDCWSRLASACNEQFFFSVLKCLNFRCVVKLLLCKMTSMTRVVIEILPHVLLRHSTLLREWFQEIHNLLVMRPTNPMYKKKRNERTFSLNNTNHIEFWNLTSSSCLIASDNEVLCGESLLSGVFSDGFPRGLL